MGPEKQRTPDGVAVIRELQIGGMAEQQIVQDAKEQIDGSFKSSPPLSNSDSGGEEQKKFDLDGMTPFEMIVWDPDYDECTAFELFKAAVEDFGLNELEDF